LRVRIAELGISERTKNFREVLEKLGGRKTQQRRERERDADADQKNITCGRFQNFAKIKTKIVHEVWEELASRRDHNLNGDSETSSNRGGKEGSEREREREGDQARR